MGKLDPKPDPSLDRPSPQLLRVLQEELSPIEPPPGVRDSLLVRILKRTVRAGREWQTRQTRQNRQGIHGKPESKRPPQDPQDD
jgi:hypothetical protein